MHRNFNLTGRLSSERFCSSESMRIQRVETYVDRILRTSERHPHIDTRAKADAVRDTLADDRFDSRCPLQTKTSPHPVLFLLARDFLSFTQCTPRFGRE